MAASDVNELKYSHPGRHAYDYTGKIEIERVPLNRMGYTRSGKYFGTGAPLWNVYSPDGDYVDFHIRAVDKAAARAKVQNAYPGARAQRRRR